MRSNSGARTLDSNASDRALRPVSVTRQASQVLGCKAAAERWLDGAAIPNLQWLQPGVVSAAQQAFWRRTAGEASAGRAAERGQFPLLEFAHRRGSRGEAFQAGAQRALCVGSAVEFDGGASNSQALNPCSAAVRIARTLTCVDSYPATLASRRATSSKSSINSTSRWLCCAPPASPRSQVSFVEPHIPLSPRVRPRTAWNGKRGKSSARLGSSVARP